MSKAIQSRLKRSAVNTSRTLVAANRTRVLILNVSTLQCFEILCRGNKFAFLYIEMRQGLVHA
jgi:hypothetical protein